MRVDRFEIDADRFESFQGSQPVRSLRRCFRVCENRRHFRGSGPGRISVAKRRHGLRRCRYKGYVGMHRWVGLGVIADNLNQHRARHGKAGSPLSHHDLRQAR